MGGAGWTVCCPVPESNSQNDPILWSAAVTRCHRRPAAHVDVGGRCDRREPRAVDTQMGSTDDFRTLGSKRLPPQNPLGVRPAAAVALEQF